MSGARVNNSSSLKFSDTDNSAATQNRQAQAERSMQAMVMKPLLQKAVARYKEGMQQKEKSLKGGNN